MSGSIDDQKLRGIALGAILGGLAILVYLAGKYKANEQAMERFLAWLQLSKPAESVLDPVVSGEVNHV